MVYVIIVTNTLLFLNWVESRLHLRQFESASVEPTSKFMKCLYCSILLAVGASGSVLAQAGVGTATPHASAQLEVSSPGKGVLLPRMNQANLPAGPAESLLVYQKDAAKGFYYYDGTKWVRLATADDLPVVPTPGAYAGYTGNTSGSAISILLGGTSIPLPNGQNLGAGITAGGGNTTFTVASAGRYRLSYQLWLTSPLLVSCRLTVNGSAVPGTVIAPVVSATDFFAEVIAFLPAGSVISLQLYGLLGIATLQTARPTSLIIQKVD